MWEKRERSSSEKEFCNLAQGHQIAQVPVSNFLWEMTAPISADLFA